MTTTDHQPLPTPEGRWDIIEAYALGLSLSRLHVSGAPAGYGIVG